MRATLPALLSLFATSASLAAEFAPNHLFVGSGSTNLVTEFDETGQFVRTIGDGAGLQGAMNPVFGPDGRLYVQNYQSNTLAVFDAAGPHGTKLKEIGASAGLDGPQGYCFGPNGHLFVASYNGSRVVEINAYGQKIRNIGVGSGISLAKDVALGPDGNLYVVDNNDLFVFDPSGVLLDKHASIATVATRIVFGRNGNLYIGDANAHVVHEITPSGHLVKNIQPQPSFDPYGLAIAPNGSLMVANDIGSNCEVEVIDADATIVKKIGSSAVFDNPSGLAISPTRFQATISGTLYPIGDKPSKLVEKHAVLSIAPGAQTVLVTLPETTANAEQLSDILGFQTFAFHGEESTPKAGATKYAIHATHRPEWFALAVLGSIELQVSGGAGSLGPAPKNVKGTLHLTSPGGVFGGAIKSTKKL